MNKKRLRFAVGEDAPAASAAGRRGWCACVGTRKAAQLPDGRDDLRVAFPRLMGG